MDEYGKQLERESEFTGLKGAILRYAGNIYTLTLVALFLAAFADATRTRRLCSIRSRSWCSRRAS